MSDKRNHMPADAILERGLPQAIDAEVSCLGTVLLNNACWDEVSKLPLQAFAITKHQQIYARMRALFERNESVTRVTLAHELMAANELEAVGLGYLADLESRSVDLDPGPDCRLIMDKFLRRAAIIRAQLTIDQAMDVTGNIGDVLSGASSQFQSLLGDAQPEDDGGRSPNQIVEEFPGGVQAFLDPSSRQKGLMTGFAKFDEMTNGLHAGEFTILAARPSVGKAQPLDALIKTPTGWVEMGSVRVGDTLASPDGLPSQVLAIHPRGVQPVFTVTFCDGRSVECCGEHLWAISSSKWYGPEDRVVSTDKLGTMVDRVRYKNRIRVPRVDGQFGSLTSLPLDPYVLGLLLGDGGLTGMTPILSTADPEILDAIRNRIPGVDLTRSGKHDYRLSFGVRGGLENPITAVLKNLGVYGLHSHKKFIPFIYLNSSRENRIELLRGLLDTDGTVGSNNGSVSFTSTSERLADGVRQLGWSIGAVCRKRSRITRYTHNGKNRPGRRSFMITISFDRPQELFRLDRKIRLTNAGRDTPTLTVLSVVPAGSKEVQCITTSHHAGLYITNDYVVTHNTALALNIATHVACHPRGPRKMVYFFSLEMNAASLLTRMLCSMARVDQHKFRAGFLNQDERYKLQVSLADLTESPIKVFDRSDLSSSTVSKIVRLGVEKDELALVIIDYLQLMTTGKAENRNVAVGQISRSLKMLTGPHECNVPLIALSQLSRPDKAFRQSPPVLQDLRDSGSLEQDADNVHFVWREELVKQDREDLRGLADLIIGKQRNGPVGKVPLRFIGQFTRFENRAEDLEQASFE